MNFLDPRTIQVSMCSMFATISIQLGINCSKDKEARGGRSKKTKLSSRNVKTRSGTKSSGKR